MRCGLYEKLLKDNTLVQPDEYIFLCTDNNAQLKEMKQEKKNYQNHGLMLLLQIIKMNFMKCQQEKYLIVEVYLLREKIKHM